MVSYYFILGRENKISQKELLLVLASFGVGVNDNSTSMLSDQVLEIKLALDPKKVADLLNILGGTVKIYQKIASGEAKLVDLLRREDLSRKVIFGLSNYSGSGIDCFRLALSAKKSLGKSIRIIAGKENDRLSSAQSFQYKMDKENIEYGIFDTGVGKLVAVQNIDLWTRHDYGKPRSDAVSGMLPPKLARVMVNLALGHARIENLESRIKNEILNSKFDILNSVPRPLVVDPFCGSGNILIEALSLGCDVIGSDVSEKAVDDTKANLEWLMQNSKIKIPACRQARQNDNAKFKIEKQDATKFDFSKINRDFVVVTEPYLGQPRKAKLRIEEEKEAKGDIGRLYEYFLKNLLTAGRRLKAICIVFPLFELANGKKLSIFQECLDFIRQIGYDIICPPMEYGRDYQVVKREIVSLKIRSTNIEARNKFEILK